ncbi:hypothetical protein [Bacillus sonorensis]|uniref:hypothetical protein n=1 Tax=Bacillus sonorensis TaxID=119858 RepID=UPI002282B590|nr:hypothetical protein [Bacillus sonorensis]MCY8402467.1 hypothetical protein [Bacillus sonorensis]
MGNSAFRKRGQADTVEEGKKADVKDEELLSLFPKTIRRNIQYRRNWLVKANAAL